MNGGTVRGGVIEQVILRQERAVVKAITAFADV